MSTRIKVKDEIENVLIEFFQNQNQKIFDDTWSEICGDVHFEFTELVHEIDLKINIYVV